MTQDPGLPSSLSKRFKNVKLFNSGGKGFVYVAKDELMNRDVAIKVLKKSSSPKELIAFQQEAKSIGQLNHPNILTIHDFVLDDNAQASMIMEFVDGMDLNAYIEKKGKLSLEETLLILIQACDGMSHAHESGIVHRDMKPHNILLDWDSSNRAEHGFPEHIKIADFGLAKYFSDDKVTTGSGASLVGTPAYISPEQARGHKGDPRSDIYSFGCVIYECLTGEKVFEAETLAEVTLKHVNEAPPKLNRITHDEKVQATIEHVIEICLSKNPEDRYQTFLELKEALEDVDELMKLAANKEVSSTRSEKREPVVVTTLSARMWKSNKATLLWVVSLLVALAAGTILTSTLLRSTERQSLLTVQSRSEKDQNSFEADKATRHSLLSIDWGDPASDTHLHMPGFSDRNIKYRKLKSIDADGLESSLAKGQTGEYDYIDGTLTIKALKVMKEKQALGLVFKPDSSLASDMPDGLEDTMKALAEVSSLKMLVLMRGQERLHKRNRLALSAKDLKPLARLKKLELLYLETNLIADGNLADLGKLPELKYVWFFPAFEITDKGVAALTESNRNFRLIHLGSCGKVTAKGVETILEREKQLQYFGLVNYWCLNQEIMNALAKSHIKVLTLAGSNADFGLIQTLKNSKTLRHLQVRGCPAFKKTSPNVPNPDLERLKKILKCKFDENNPASIN